MGSTCIAESCREESLVHETIRLFNKIGYRGPGSIEFKKDSKSGEYKIVEPTVGRADLQSAIAHRAGLNFSLMDYCDCLNIGLPKPGNTKKRLVWINEENLRWVLGNRLGHYSMVEWARLLIIPKAYALFDRSDIRPFHVFLRSLFKRSISR